MRVRLGRGRASRGRHGSPSGAGPRRVVEAVGGRVTQLPAGRRGVWRGAGHVRWIRVRFRERIGAQAGQPHVRAGRRHAHRGGHGPPGLRDHGRVQPGQTVLINGAAGGVGTFAVQIANALGADVTGVCSTREPGDGPLDRRRPCHRLHGEDFTRGSKRYDLILDLVGNHSVSACRRALAPNGMRSSPTGAAATGSAPWASPPGDGDVQVHKPGAARVHGARHERGPGRSQGARRGREGHAGHRSDLSAEREPGRVAYLEAGHARGKVVLAVQEHHA